MCLEFQFTVEEADSRCLVFTPLVEMSGQGYLEDAVNSGKLSAMLKRCTGYSALLPELIIGSQ